MIYLGFFVIILFILADYIWHRNIYSPIFLFSGLFLLILSLAFLQFNNMRDFSDKSIYTIEIGVIFFSIGCFLIEFIRKSLKKDNISYIQQDEKELKINWVVTDILLVLVNIGLIVYVVYAMKILGSGANYSQIRDSLLGYENQAVNEKQNILLNLVSVISVPGLYALIPIAIYYFVNSKHKLFTYVVFLDLVINVFSSGGRIILLYTIIQFMAIMKFSNIQVSKKVKRRLLVIIFIAFISIILISVFRSSKSILETTYSYFSGPVVLLSEWQKYIDNYNFWSYGLSFFYPITYILNFFTKLLGLNIEILENVVSWQGLPQETWLAVFPNRAMNAFSTLFYFFYLDLRYFGVIIFSTVFGVICGNEYYKSFIEKNIKHFIIYLFLLRGILGSFIKWQLGSTTFFISLFMLFLCLRRKKIKFK